MLPRPSKDEYSRKTSMAATTNVSLPMRDGTVLYADVFRPSGDGRFPVLLTRIPYGKHRPKYHAHYLDLVRAVSRGYAVVIQDTRGRHLSEGEFYPFRHEVDDGYDTVEWCAAQPWSDGNVGMYGISYHGATQLLCAVGAPPSLKAITPALTSDSYYDSWTYLGGAFQSWFASVWAGGDLVENVTGHTPEQEEVLAELRRWKIDPLSMPRYLPLKDMPALKGLADFYYDWLAHPTDDSYWKALSPRERFDKVQVPALHIAGWFDLFLRGNVRAYQGIRQRGATDLARGQQHLLIGPWVHEEFPNAHAGQGAFDREGSGEAIDLQGMMLAWFDRWLKGEHNGVDADPAVHYFTMGADRWSSAEVWPPPESSSVGYFLRSGGRANTRDGDGALSVEQPSGPGPPDHYVYDPLHPVSTLGGPYALLDPATVPVGVQEQHPVETREDVLVYTSRPLERGLEVTGDVTLGLWAVTSAADTDWTAKLVDVHPDGRAYNVCEGILRARYRKSLEEPTLIEPGRPYRYQIDLGPTSMYFKAGHRVRLQVSSSNFPAFARNLNMGGAHHEETGHRVALQTVLHDADHPSRLMLPVMPDASTG